MKVHASSLLLILSGIVSVSHAALPSHVQPPPRARGHYLRFDAPTNGRGRIRLFDGGPDIACDFRPGRGPRNPRGCLDGATSVMVVDAECPESSLFRGNPNKKCFAASISAGRTGKVFHVNSAGLVNERDTADYPDEEHPPNEDHPDDDLTLPTNERRLLRGANPIVTLPEPSERLLSSTPVIDVLVVYTQGAKASAANYHDGPIVDLVHLAIAETNQAYINSGINAELRLAGGAPHEDTSGYTADVGSTSMSPSLNHLTRTAGSSQDPDGLLDYVHQMRTDVGADMVALITTGAGCGVAWLSGQCEGCLPSKGSQFSVTKYSCATGYYSFGHELGHNMGCHHDKGTTGACGSSNGKYGYRGTDGTYRSILSYSCNTSQCDSNVGGSCTRSMFFSNPNNLWDGKPMGAAADDTVTGLTDNAAHINAVAQRIADFYTAPDNATPEPTSQPTTGQPTTQPTEHPTNNPSSAPTSHPTNPPTEPVPTMSPTPGPTANPSGSPTKAPSGRPTTSMPTRSPTDQPTNPPTEKCFDRHEAVPGNCNASTNCCNNSGCQGGNGPNKGTCK